MFGHIKQMLMGLLGFSGSLYNIVNTPDQIKCISLNNQQFMTQHNFINLHPNA